MDPINFNILLWCLVREIIIIKSRVNLIYCLFSASEISQIYCDYFRFHERVRKFVVAVNNSIFANVYKWNRGESKFTQPLMSTRGTKY